MRLFGGVGVKAMIADDSVAAFWVLVFVVLIFAVVCGCGPVPVGRHCHAAASLGLFVLCILGLGYVWFIYARVLSIRALLK